ncbi:hypothetical protein HIM_10904 [Hirsutella minnesotensis 3608]|uniref:Isotrichodermin C-15 hydroxylase n=1 Tax=Hirsutella minnesotensis 3608 TaxID=1043627 RepID=A0A0F7ZJK4_9HYPO|nr:hypothetical protein HIM_10904 [Hirsutella minnesotensis 3608]
MLFFILPELAVATLAISLCTRFVYNLFFHPLHIYPGPKLWAVSRIPYIRCYLSGHAHRVILDLHLRYGPVVRIAPDELSYSHPDAWKDIMGHQPSPRRENEKDAIFFPEELHGGIIDAKTDNHRRMRRILSQSFSMKALRQQEVILQQYMDVLMSRLREQCARGNRTHDISLWFNWTTFDATSNLAFGESFQCLKNGRFNSFVDLIFQAAKAAAFRVCAVRYSFLAPLLSLLIPRKTRQVMKEHYRWSEERISAILSSGKQHLFLGADAGDESLSYAEAVATSNTLIFAGAETTGTALSAAVFYLAKNTRAYEKLMREVRSTFSTEDQINITSVQTLQYMSAVLNETLRMYPPVPSGIPRRICKSGNVVLGQYVPEDTIVSIWQWSLYRNPAFFSSPDDFLPERWLENATCATVSKKAFQPFSYGPRDCIGKYLANAEMRLVLSRLILNFDFELAEGHGDWEDKSEVYILWDKGPLPVCLTTRGASNRPDSQ